VKDQADVSLPVVGDINGDLSVGLARLPVEEWIGVQSDSPWAADGIAVGTATLCADRVLSDAV
jgi:hypothetical protein